MARKSANDVIRHDKLRDAWELGHLLRGTRGSKAMQAGRLRRLQQLQMSRCLEAGGLNRNEVGSGDARSLAQSSNAASCDITRELIHFRNWFAGV